MPMLTNFTIGNTPPSATAANTSTGIAILAPDNGINLLTLWDNVAPGSTFTVTVGRNASQITGNSETGIAIGDASGKIETWAYNPESGPNPGAIDCWNSYTSYNSTPATVVFNQLWQFLRVVYNGTSFLFYAGNDLNSLVLFETLSATAFLSTPTNVGFFANGDSVALSATYFHYLHTA
jgi:hypothetical protein